MESSHENFDLLCAMVAAHQASPEEERLLANHAESCEACRHSMEQFRQVVWLLYQEKLAMEEEREPVPLSREEGAEKAQARDRLLRELHVAQAPTLTGERFRSNTERNDLRRKMRSLRGAPAWASWAVAAALLIAVGVNSAQYWSSRRFSGDEAARAVTLQKEVDQLREDLAKERTERAQSAQLAAENSKQEAAAESSQTRKLLAENQDLKRNLEESEAAREQQARDFVALRDRERLLQSSLEVLQASQTSLHAENAGLEDKISKLTDDLKKSREESTALTARNEELSQETLTKVKYAERQQKLLATDHDIRDILGSRSLHIIDVYDVSGSGELERPFGRIFYTEGKSLIFYAFDLDQQKGLKRGAVFQAWGQKGPAKEKPRSLGTFYMDDSAQNRWVLKVDDSKTLSRIDYVFVTDSSRKEGIRPKGKPLLSAFLNGPANHP
ncbi:MAG: hypothetical protein DMG40_01090 [Acidobacteria bacterium]|nr:MAG: hypothetical protein DMG40_01090 [Acidobacteriota bacterium]